MMMVKGKVQNGVIEVIAVTEGRMVGYRKPLRSNQPAVKVEPVVQPVVKQETLDIPDFMKARSKEMQKQKRMKRIFKTI